MSLKHACNVQPSRSRTMRRQCNSAIGVRSQRMRGPEMPNDGTDSNSHVSKVRAETHELFSPQQDMRPSNRYLTEVTDGDGDYCVMLCTLPHGVVVPMHSHADRETFFVVSGNPDAFRGDHWETLGAGDVFDAQ